MKGIALRKSTEKVASRSRMSQGRIKPENRATPVHPFLRLQSSIGNQAVSRLIQAKLQRSEPGHACKREADWMAEQLMRMPERVIQRNCFCLRGWL